MPEGVEFPFPSLLFHEGRTYGQPEVVRISLPQVATGLALTLAGLVPSAGIFAGNEPSGHACMSIWRLPRQPANLFAGSCRPAHAAGGTLAQRAFRQFYSC